AEDVLAALAAGHTYAKLRAAGPDLRFSALGDDGGTGIMGDAIPDRAATLSASVLNLPAKPQPHLLRLIRDRSERVEEVDVTTDGTEHAFRVERPGAYHLELVDTGLATGVVVAVTSAIRVPEPSAAATTAAAFGTLAAAAASRRRPRARRRPASGPRR